MAWTEADRREGRSKSERYFGKYAGTVVDNGPPDSGAHRGEVKVSVPGILEETPGGAGNRPVQVSALPALPPGFFFVPEKDDNVWVEFVDGDINFPVWSGVWYPADKSPHATGGAAPTQDQKVVRTKSGLVAQLDDTSGSEQIVVKDEKNGNVVTLDKSGISVAASGASANITLKVGQSSLVIESSAITLKSGTAAIKLGSGGVTITDITGSAQPAVLKPFADWFNQTFLLWATTHMHATAAPGPPTPPAPPPVPPSPNPAQSTSSSG